MRVCDITREDEVVAAYTIVKHTPGEKPNMDDEAHAVTIETGKRADQAFSKRDWAALARLVPYSLRPKDPNRTEGAKKAQATRAAKKAAAAAGTGATEATNGSAPATTAPSSPAGTGAQAAAKTPVTA